MFHRTSIEHRMFQLYSAGTKIDNSLNFLLHTERTQ
uniref:Uncharacterized protein n=1 Tax=Anguilla anguilla TaxID=7936 RepID=A0A0E9R1W0_ANGAN